jgi:hypothetical protein
VSVHSPGPSSDHLSLTGGRWAEQRPSDGSQPFGRGPTRETARLVEDSEHATDGAKRTKSSETSRHGVGKRPVPGVSIFSICEVSNVAGDFRKVVVQLMIASRQPTHMRAWNGASIQLDMRNGNNVVVLTVIQEDRNR